MDKLLKRIVTEQPLQKQQDISTVQVLPFTIPPNEQAQFPIGNARTIYILTRSGSLGLLSSGPSAAISFGESRGPDLPISGASWIARIPAGTNVVTLKRSPNADAWEGTIGLSLDPNFWIEGALFPNLHSSKTLQAQDDTVEINTEGMAIVYWERGPGLGVSETKLEGQLSGSSTWQSLNFIKGGYTGFTVAAQVTTTDSGFCLITGLARIRMRVSMYTSGSAVCRLTASRAAGQVRIAGSVEVDPVALQPNQAVSINGGQGGLGTNVDVNLVNSLPAGIANIGDVDVVTLPGGLTARNEDTVAFNADPGVPVLAARNDAAATKTSADGDYSHISVDAAGRVGVTGLGGSLTIDDGGGFISIDDGGAVITVDGTINAIGELNHDLPNTLPTLQVGGNASPTDVPQTLVGTNDRCRIWLDRAGAIVTRRRKLRESYTAVFRLAEAAARLDQTFTQVANTNKQWATLHHTAAATTELRLMYLACFITAWSVATQGTLELRQISAAPVTGNPAITPAPHRRGGTAAQAICLYLPTTAGTEASVNTPLAHVPFDQGILAAVSTLNPIAERPPIVLYNAAWEDDEEMPPVLPVGILDGWAVVLRTVGAPAVRMTIVARFTEEIP